MQYHLTPRWLIVIAATTALTATSVSTAQPDASDGHSVLARELASAIGKLDKSANKLAAVEDAVDKARADVDNIANELEQGGNPKSVTAKLLAVRTRVNQSQMTLDVVAGVLATLEDTFKKIQLVALKRDAPKIASEAAGALQKVGALQTRAKTVQTKIEKVNQGIKKLLHKARG